MWPESNMNKNKKMTVHGLPQGRQTGSLKRFKHIEQLIGMFRKIQRCFVPENQTHVTVQIRPCCQLTVGPDHDA